MHSAPSPKKISFLMLLFSLFLFFLLFSLSMRYGLNHDEHQFIASAALLANDSLLPYIDYPYFHMPYLVFIYAGLFQLSPYLLWSARFFSMLCGWLTLVLTFAIGWQLFSAYKPILRFEMAVGGALLLLTNPLFTHTSGRSWNHDLPVLLTLLAFICLQRAMRSHSPTYLLALSGLLIGVATGVRLSFAVVTAPFAIIIFLLPTLVDDWHTSRGKALLFFAGGIFLGLLPALVLFGMAPERFWFGNFGYAELNTRYYDQIRGQEKAMTIGGKFVYLAMLLVQEPSNLLLVLLFLGLLQAERGRLKSLYNMLGKPQEPTDLDLLFLLLMQPFLLIGAFAASPSQEQYFFVMVPFLILALLYLLASHRHLWQSRFFALITVLTCLLAMPEYITVWRVFFPDEWQPMKVERDAKELAALTQGGKVLTVAPVLPLEGELEIYPALATGSFALRVAPLVPKEVRQKLGLFSEEELLELIGAEPPRAILVGRNNDDKPAEGAIVAYASEHNYVQWKLPDDSYLWLSPLVDWGGKIRLATYTHPSEALALEKGHQITFYLQAIAPIEGDLNVLVRLVGRDGNEIWRDEGWPFGSATSTWEIGQVWADGHEIVFPPDKELIPAGYYRLDLSFYDPETLEALPAQSTQTGDSLGNVLSVDYLAVGDLPTSPATPLNPPAEIGSAIRLLGHERHQNFDASDDQRLQLRLFWQTQSPIKNNYKVFVHLIGPDGQLVSQQDQEPLGGFLPTSRWRTNYMIPDDYELQLPPDIPPEGIEIRVGMYDPTSLERLPITIGGEAAGDFVVLARGVKSAD